MAFRRVTAVPELPLGEKLTGRLIGIGMNLAGPAIGQPNIEDTVLSASVEGMEHDDLRVLSILTTWLRVHHRWLNADRMMRALTGLARERTRAYWAAVGQWLSRDRRLARLSRLYQGGRVDVLRTGTYFHLRRNGEDERFAGGPLRVPAAILRDRTEDVLTPSRLALLHRTYRARVLMGPTYRTDMWVALDEDPDLTPARLARKTYGSFATAWQVKRDWALFNAQALGSNI